MERNTKKSIWLKQLATKLCGPQDWIYEPNPVGDIPCHICTKSWTHVLSMYADCGGFGSRPKYKRLKFSDYTDESQAEQLARVLTELFQKKNIEARVRVYKMKRHWGWPSDRYAVSVNGLQDYPWNY